jgi:hypothetical protein
MWPTWKRAESVQGFGGKDRRKKPLGRPRRRLEDGNRMYLTTVGWECGVDSPGSRYGSLAGCCEYGDELLSTRAVLLVNWPMAEWRRTIFVRLWERNFIIFQICY